MITPISTIHEEWKAANKTPAYEAVGEKGHGYCTYEQERTLSKKVENLPPAVAT